MALRWRLAAVPESRPQDGGDPIVAWKQGDVFLDVEVYDDATPATVILSRPYQFASSKTNQQMIDAITADLSRLKAAFDRRVGLLPSVGATFPIP